MSMQITIGIASITLDDDRMVIIIDKEKPVILTKAEVISAFVTLNNSDDTWKCGEVEITVAPYGATLSINDPAGGRVCQGIEQKEMMALGRAIISYYDIQL
jgi:hypothetical protein